MIVTYRVYKQHNSRKEEQDAFNDPRPRTNPVPAAQSMMVSAGEEETEEERRANRSSLLSKISLMVALAFPVFLETLDYTVVATGQSHVASAFNRLDLLNYIGTLYVLTSTVSLFLFASLADIFGRHATLQVSLLCFLVGSAISTGSMNMIAMLAGRGLAGIGAGGLMAVVHIILLDSQTVGDNNWQRRALIVLHTSGYAVGPFLGGFLTSISFRWVFALNLPFAFAAINLAFFLLRGRTKGPQAPPEHEIDGPGGPREENVFKKLLRIDWVGPVLFTEGGILTLLALNWGSTQRWDSAKVIACFIAGGLIFLVYGLWEYYLECKAAKCAALAAERGGALASQGSEVDVNGILQSKPMIPLVLFRDRDICIVQFATLVNGMVMLVMSYFLALFMTVVNRLSPLQVAQVLIFFAPGLGAGTILAILAIKRVKEPYYPIAIGGIVGTAGVGLLAMGLMQNNRTLINAFMAMSGAGIGLMTGPLAIQAKFSQTKERIAIMSTLTLFSRSLGGAIGLAQCGAILNAKVTSHLAGLSHSFPSSTFPLNAASIRSLQQIDALSPDVQAAVRDAYRIGMQWCFHITRAMSIDDRGSNETVAANEEAGQEKQQRLGGDEVVGADVTPADGRHMLEGI